MTRTPLAGAIARIVDDIAEDEGPLPRITRRGFLAGAAATAFVAAMGPLPARAAAPRIVIVGAGLAGLACARQLVSSGVEVMVYEAGARVGGRCWTRRGDFASDQIVEHGGELIDQSHTAIRQLAQSLGLDLDNLLAAEVNGTEQFNWLGGAPYTFEQATSDMKDIWQQVHKDVSAAGYPTLFDSSTQRGRELDRMSIVDWIEQFVPGGRRSRLGSLLEVAYTIEYGGEASGQSSLNMLYLLAFIGQGRMRILGQSNEKYHVRGGNDQIATRLAAELGDRVRLGSRLESIAREADGTWTLGFVQGTKRVSVRADHVVMTIPFSILRTLDYSKAAFSTRKVQAIRELGVGTNSKFHLQFTDRVWVAQGKSGETFSDRGYQNTWEVTRAQQGREGILVDYTGGLVGDTFASGSVDQHAALFFDQIAPVIPGLRAAWNGLGTIDHWPSQPLARGSYSFWKVRQYTSFAGIEGRPEGSCHFAGEHTSIDFQGYLNGAVETGQRAAAEVLDAVA
jgi:monoamine oxidase